MRGGLAFACKGDGTVIENKATPTQAQLDYARKLMTDLGYDCQDIREMCGKDFDDLTRFEMSSLIGNLKDEMEG